jgi:hypothetical protein
MNLQELSSFASKRSWVVALIGAALAAPIASAAPRPARPAVPAIGPAARAYAPRDLEYGRVPLHFEPNRGQAPADARFVAHGDGYRLDLTPSGPVLRTASGDAATAPEAEALSVRFAGASPAPEIAGLDPLPGRVNYLRGSDPSDWLVRIPTFASVAYRDLYPGVDLLWYGNAGRVEYDVVVAPGADPRSVRLDVSASRRATIDARGDLLLEGEAGVVTMRKPFVYQERGGARREVASEYVALGGGEIGFRVGTYDPSLPLVIDPVLAYATYLGGNGFDQAYNVAVDAAGNAYVTGVAYTANFPTTAGAYQRTPTGTDAFVTKLAPDGRTLVYSTYLAGANCQGIAVDASGSAYLTGYAAINFPTTPGAFETMLRGGFDAFVTKLAPDGSSLVYSTLLGGSFDDFGYDVAVDASGNAYVTGNTAYRAPGPGDFPTVNAVQPAYGGGNEDAFVAKVNATGSALVYSTYLGGGQILNATDDWGEGIAVDAGGSAYVTGYTYSPDFPTTAGAYDRSRAGLDAFVVKFSPGGTSLVYSTFLGAAGREQGYDIAVDAGGNAYVAGLTESEDNPFTPEYDGFPTTPGAFQPTGSFDAFVTKLDPQGSGLVYSTYLGGAADVDRAWGIAIDSAGNAYVSGDTKSPNFPVVDAVQPNYGGGLGDAFAAKLNASGSALVYSTFLGGNLADEARAVAVSANGASAYVVGSTSSFNFPSTPGVVQPFNAGGVEHHDDAFVVKLSGAAAAPAGDTIGAYTSSSGGHFLRGSNSSGPADWVFQFGAGSLVALSGDWDGDGDDTPGLYDQAAGTFFLKNSNSSGSADLVFGFGPSGGGWTPLAGDWNGDGVDTVGLYNPANGFFFLRNANAPGGADATFGFGPGGASWAPLAGDWNGDGADTVGLYNPANGFFFLRNANTPGAADLVFGFGPGGAGWQPITGDWNGDGVESVGLYSPSNGFFFLKNANAAGPADTTFGYGPPNAAPLAGDWGG